MNTNSDWDRKLFSKSLLKQAKWRRIERMLPAMDGRRGLDIGADNGVLSRLLRERGGDWSSADTGAEAVASIRALVGESVSQISAGKLPYGNEEFDCVVIIDMLEHLEDDAAFIKECHRVLKPAGRLIVNVPHLKKGSILRPIRNMLGLTDAEHGHLRPGYTQQHLFGLMIDGFDVEEASTYSRFFVELLDTFIRLAAKGYGDSDGAGEKGMIMDEERFAKMRKLFRIYSVLYPIFWMASKLDHLIFFTRGHYLIVRARRRLWIPRRIPIIKDGRSIADAALNTRIGSANPF